jgi:zinc transport system ATP-binding protein
VGVFAQSWGIIPHGARVNTILEVEGLSIRFGRTQILSNVAFRVTRGASLAIIGPNGAGKTALFRALVGSLPSDGVVRWAPDARIGYVPQKLDLDRDVPITARDLLRARAALTRDKHSAMVQALGAVGLSPDAGEAPIGTLSGGQFQRLLIAFALAGNPNVLLLDEPTAGVDEPGQERLHELIARLQGEQGMTVIFISHELSVVYRYATEVVCLAREQVCAGPPREILTPELLRQIYGAPLDFHVHDH